MNFFSPNTIKEELKKHNLHPKKKFGQNFLIDKNIADIIINTLNIKKSDVIVEIGSGLGSLTHLIAAEAKKVIAVETDTKLLDISKDLLSAYNNIEFINKDILKTSFNIHENYKVVGNIPYYITTPVILFLLDIIPRPELFVLMIQKEVAQRLTAKPGSKAYGSLSIFVQYRCRVEIVKYIKKTAFYPQPDVDSALVKFTLLEKPPVKLKNEKLFFDIIRAGFMYRRKTLINAISRYSNLGIAREELEKTLKHFKLSPNIRAEKLSMSELADLSNYIKQQK